MSYPFLESLPCLTALMAMALGQGLAESAPLCKGSNMPFFFLLCMHFTWWW